jgi:hypothetical protein
MTAATPIPETLFPKTETVGDLAADNDLINQTIWNIDCSVQDKAYLPKGIPAYEDAIKRARTVKVAKRIARAILRHAPNLPDPAAATIPILTAFFRVPLDSKVEQRAADMLANIATVDPDIKILVSKFPEIKAKREIWRKNFHQEKPSP